MAEIPTTSSQLNDKSDKHTQVTNGNCTVSANRYQLLKNRKIELERKLNEKYSQLQSILREVR